MADPIVGIDLGTSNSVVAVCDQGGNVKVLSDDAGFKVQPSVVSFHPNGAVIVGAEAKQRKVLDPKNTVYSAKRLIGRTYRSREVQTTIGRMPYVINEGGNQAPMIVTRAGEFAVPEISAIVLDHMRKLASRALGAEVGRAVVTVPASFTEAQRTATATAGAIAGMTIVRVLNEPTAAALAYGHTRQLRRTIAVYDFGGGTFDITVLKLDDNVYEVLGTSGDTFLGGDDIDERVVDQLVEGFLAQNRIDLRQNEIAMMRLRAVAEQTKIELSRRSRAIIKVDEIAYGPGGAPLNLQQELTRDQLVAGCVDVVDRTFPVCDEAMKLAGLRTLEIDDIVLVGGTTKMPYVRDRVAAYFGKAPRTDINPEEAVAIGAALQAAALERLLSKRPSVRATGSQAPARAPADEETTGGEITYADELPGADLTLERDPPTGSTTLDALPSIGGADTFIGENAQTKPGEARITAPLAGAAPAARTGPGLGNPNAKSQPGLRNPASQSQSGLRNPASQSQPGLGGRPAGDRPVQRGEAIDRFEDRGNIIPPGAPIARMTKTGAAPAPGRTLHGLPSQMMPPEQAPTPPGRPMTAPPPVPAPGAPPPIPGRRTSNLGAIPPSAPGAPLTTLEPMLTPAPGIPASQSQSGLGPHPSASQPGLGRPPPVTAPGVVPPPRGVQPAQFTEIPTKPADVIRSLEEPTRPAAAGLEELLLQTDIATKPAGANLERLIRETEPPPRPPGPEPGAVPIFDPLSGMISAPTPAPALIAPTAAAAAPTMIITPQAPPPPQPSQTMRGRVDGPAASQGLGSTAKGVPPPPAPMVPNLLVPNIIDVTPRAFGIATVAGYCEELIRRNQRLPTETRKTFITSRDRQQVVRIQICQGESRRLDDNVVIGDLVLENLEPRPRGETSIEVTFAIDASGILNVRARDARSGREQSAALDIIGAQSPDEVATSRDRLQQMRR